MREGTEMMKTPYLVALLLVQPALLDATTALLVRTNKSIYIGTDSLRTLRETDTGRLTDHRLVCKIRAVGGVHIVTAGIPEYPATGFSLDALVDQAALRRGSLGAKAEAFDEIAVAPLTALAAHLRANNPYFGDRYVNSYFVQIAFAGIENGKPVIIVRRFKPILDEQGRLTPPNPVRGPLPLGRIP